MTTSAAPDTADLPPQLGALMRRHRLRIGLTQRELADLSTISVRAIRDLEQGRATRPRSDTIRLIADGLRLGPRARADLESAARQGRRATALHERLTAAPPAPPRAANVLFGRGAETAVVTDELARGTERLVNLVGLSGVGKTRLALEVAARLHGEAGLPVLWYAWPGAPAEYRADRDAEEFAGCVEALVRYLFGTADDDPAPFLELIGDRPAVLVIDGVIAQRPHEGRLARLLRECPGLRLLVTCDRPWDTPGERAFLLTPLTAPDGTTQELLTAEPEDLAQVTAVQLFLFHARRVRPEFVLDGRTAGPVADICRRLDGLPLALRAAAGWLVVYDVETLRDCLAHDPAVLLDHFTDAGEGARLRACLERGLHGLDAGQLTLLDEVCRGDGDFGLEDVMALTGRTLPECGRLVRDLLLRGVVRPSHRPGRSRFLVLGLVTVVWRGAGPRLRSVRASAPGVPEELPLRPAAPVFDGFHQSSAL
ncbi:helix-turn-helix domain-containing protein [Streptomyces sp. NPDC017936]|uniref:helix-turn-helix domain-containing protein n=1 Tax=Streptomyces sp. NPDC017936 TaxID=3365016 RepID=UPI003798BE8D